jgi:hypothetical protein
LLPVDDSKSKAADDADIFETDFEVPALDEDSSSIRGASLDDADTDLESSDFDLALNEEDAVAEEESGSEVVALEDEDAEETATALAGGRRKPGLGDEEAVDEILTEEEAEQEEVAPGVAAPPAPWGWVPLAGLIPTTIILLLGVLMGFELLHTMSGYRQPKATGTLVHWMAKTVGFDVSD